MSLLFHSAVSDCCLQFQSKFQMPESPRKPDDAALPKRFGAIASSLNSIGGRIGNAIEVSFLELPVEP